MSLFRCSFCSCRVFQIRKCHNIFYLISEFQRRISLLSGNNIIMIYIILNFDSHTNGKCHHISHLLRCYFCIYIVQATATVMANDREFWPDEFFAVKFVVFVFMVRQYIMFYTQCERYLTVISKNDMVRPRKLRFI